MIVKNKKSRKQWLTPTWYKLQTMQMCCIIYSVYTIHFKMEHKFESQAVYKDTRVKVPTSLQPAESTQTESTPTKVNFEFKKLNLG